MYCSETYPISTRSTVHPSLADLCDTTDEMVDENFWMCLFALLGFFWHQHRLWEEQGRAGQGRAVLGC